MVTHSSSTESVRWAVKLRPTENDARRHDKSEVSRCEPADGVSNPAAEHSLHGRSVRLTHGHNPLATERRMRDSNPRGREANPHSNFAKLGSAGFHGILKRPVADALVSAAVLDGMGRAGRSVTPYPKVQDRADALSVVGASSASSSLLCLDITDGRCTADQRPPCKSCSPNPR